MFRKYIILGLMLFLCFSLSLKAYAQVEGDEAIFASVAPDVLIVLDTSGLLGIHPVRQLQVGGRRVTLNMGHHRPVLRIQRSAVGMPAV